MSIDAAVTGDRNVFKKEAEKIVLYQDLIREVQRMCNVKANVIPVIIWATGTISKSLTQYLTNVPESKQLSNSIKQPQCALHTDCGMC